MDDRYRIALQRIAAGDTPVIKYKCGCGRTSPGGCDAMGACAWNRPRVLERVKPDKFARDVLKGAGE